MQVQTVAMHRSRVRKQHRQRSRETFLYSNSSSYASPARGIRTTSRFSFCATSDLKLLELLVLRTSSSWPTGSGANSGCDSFVSLDIGTERTPSTVSWGWTSQFLRKSVATWSVLWGVCVDMGLVEKIKEIGGFLVVVTPGPPLFSRIAVV